MNISGGRIQLLALILKMCVKVPAIHRQELEYRLKSQSEVHTLALIQESLFLGLKSDLIRESEDSTLELTHLGESAMKSAGGELFETEMRILTRLITTVRRDLLKIGFMSIEELEELAPNERECLQQFGLLDYHLSPAAERWWAGLRSAGESFDSAILKEVGDRAELASMNFEEARLRGLGLSHKTVDWVSRETDFAGYDILSYVGEPPETLDRLCIEVKKLTSNPSGGFYFFVSRNEADVARKSANYVFHLWQSAAHSTKWEVSIISANTVLEKLPKDTPNSNWETCRVFVSASQLEKHRVSQ